MENKTAVEWLIDQLDSDIRNSLVVQQALELEKQQIMDAYDKISMSTADEYYSETYKKSTK